MLRRLALVALTAAWVAPSAARAQLFSPGKLARGHSHLEGLDNCTQCHPRGGKLDAKLCLDCHTELAARVTKKEGYHGQAKVRKQACEKCHHDHEGLDYQMIRWTPKAFDHREAGWALAGAHARADCESCHEPRLIKDKKVAKRLRNQHKSVTFLGLGEACRDCHFDEHRGQLKGECSQCHDEEKFDPAKGFSHDDARFALRGAHRDVDCDKCHPAEPDAETKPGAFPKPVSMQFARYRPVEHAQCTSCHEDPHEGRFGEDCLECHDEIAWDRIKAPKNGKRAFHDKTRYPLREAHAFVACDACHLPLGKRKQVFKGLPFDRCDRCHFDGHQGQVEGDCEGCHTLEGFLPATYGEPEHAKTEYPLDGAHEVVGCARCHVAQERPERPSRRLAKALKRRKRSFLVSDRQLALGARRCLECHEDAHRGQLELRVDKDGCEGCHQVAAWTEVTLDHDAETRYPLTGKHAEVKCEGCHARPAPGEPVRYRPLETACASCHVDAHFGQLADAAGKTDCARCHDTKGFDKAPGFDHDVAAFALTGRHSKVDCAKCHLTVEAGNQSAVRYKPLPTECEGCHVDYHQGAFDRFAKSGHAGRCAECHAVDGWAPATFDHAQVGWALEGRHGQARCGSCHGSDLARPIERDCASCHTDPHRGELGLRCASCHVQTTWKSRYDADAHRASAFPLAGAHAVIPCEECHTDTFGRGFVRAAVGCNKCHSDDYTAAAVRSIDHVEAGFDTQCLRCHNPRTFENGRFDGHDACFLISAGDHAGITCQNCHDSLQGVRVDGTCNTRTAACTSCHEHSRDETDPEHRDVPGYEYEDRKCYECHQIAVQ